MSKAHEMAASPAEDAAPQTGGRARSWRARLRLPFGVDGNVIALACVVGALAGVLASGYAFALDAAMRFFEGLPATLPVYLVMPAAGLLVGLAYRLGEPGETDAVVDNIHVRNGRLDTRANLPLIPISIVSIAAGGSAGPEAPMVYLTGSVGTWLHRWLKLPERYVRTLTLTGMGVGFATLFGAPVGAAIFALEIPHKRGIEYFEATVPAIIGALVGHGVFLAITGRPAGPVWHFAPYAFGGAKDLLAALAVGLFCGVVSLPFVGLIKALKRAFAAVHAPMCVKASLGGAILGAVAFWLPATRFWGEAELQTAILDASPALWMLLALAGAKMLTVSVTLASGWRGGIILPCFFIGACLGRALACVIPGLDPTLSMLAGMAAVNVAVMKVPLSTVLVVAAMSGVAAVPPIAAAAFGAFVVAGGVGLLDSKRGRLWVTA